MAGVGTEIKRVLESFGITAHSGCGCTNLANEMDRVGIDSVEANLSLYTEKMKESIKKWKGNRPIPIPPDFLIEKLIVYGINKARVN